MKKLHTVLLVIIFVTAVVVFTDALGGVPGLGTRVAPAASTAEAQPEGELTALMYAGPPEDAPPEETASAGPSSSEARLGVMMFLGDSLLANPERLNGIFSAHGHQILAGNGATIPEFFEISERTLTVGASGLGTMTGSLTGRYFEGIVILLGANDISFLTPSQVMSDYQTLLEELTEHFDVPVFVLKVYPAGAAYGSYYAGSAEDRNRKTAELNELLEAYCAETDGIRFADAAAAFTDSAGYLLHDGGDGLHIDPSYYEDFFAEIERAVLAASLET